CVHLGAPGGAVILLVGGLGRFGIFGIAGHRRVLFGGFFARFCRRGDLGRRDFLCLCFGDLFRRFCRPVFLGRRDRLLGRRFVESDFFFHRGRRRRTRLLSGWLDRDFDQ